MKESLILSNELNGFLTYGFNMLLTKDAIINRITWDEQLIRDLVELIAQNEGKEQVEVKTLMRVDGKESYHNVLKQMDTVKAELENAKNELVKLRERLKNFTE